MGNSEEIHEGHVAFATFDPTDMSAMEARLVSKGIFGEAEPTPSSTYHHTKQLEGSHHAPQVYK